MKSTDIVTVDGRQTLEYLKSRFPLYHLSNIFFRDIQYGILAMLRERRTDVGYAEAELLARRFVETMEKEKIFIRIDRQTWALNYPAFRTPRVVKEAPAKPAPKAAVPAAGAQPSTPTVSEGGGVAS